MRAFGECQPISGVGVTDMVDTSSYYGWPEFHQQDDIGLRPAVGGPRFASLPGDVFGGGATPSLALLAGIALATYMLLRR